MLTQVIQSVFFDLIAIIAGGIITWFVSQVYYVRAAKELNAETCKIRNLLRISLQAMEDTNMVTLNRDQSGEIVGMIHNVAVVDTLAIADEQKTLPPPIIYVFNCP